MRYWLCVCLCLGLNSVQAQKMVDWTQLSEVVPVQKMDLITGQVIRQPHFSRAIKALEDQQIEISGYILPLAVEGGVYALSRYTYADCFFCGGAGLTSVMDIWFTKPDQRYQLDQQVTLRGILRLDDSGDGLLYLLDEAVEVK